jgi:hypothetical protein
LELLLEFDDVYTTSPVINELIESENEEIINPLTKALRKWLRVLDNVDYIRASIIQRSFPHLSLVDCELLVVCQDNDCILFSDDGRLLKVAAREYGIKSNSLYKALLALKRKGVLNTKEIKEIIIELEKKDRYKFSSSKEKELLQ